MRLAQKPFRNKTHRPAGIVHQDIDWPELLFDSLGQGSASRLAAAVRHQGANLPLGRLLGDGFNFIAVPGSRYGQAM